MPQSGTTRQPGHTWSSMPEGHTIHALARDLRREFAGAPIVASSPQGRFSAGAARIDGTTMVRSAAWGKYLFVDFDDGSILHVHLGLIGKFRPTIAAPTDPATTVRLRLGEGDAAWDLTGPARCELVEPHERRRIVDALGPDPLRRNAAARLPDLIEALERTSRPIGATLLDQSIVAGIGNVYRAEILFLCGIDPRRPSSSLSDDEVDRVWRTTIELMQIGVRLRRIVTTDPEEIGRQRGRMRDDERLYVYHREHCRRCGSELRTDEVAGRRIDWCPTCQH